jgi:predicted transcriptional regulator
MPTLLEMAQQIVSAHATKTPITTTELISEIQKVHAALQSLESGAITPETKTPPESSTPTLTLKQAFKTNEVVCMICGKGFKALTRHLSQTHQMKPTEYRKQFNIPKTQVLMSKAYAIRRKEISAGMDLGANLEKARLARGNTGKKSNVPAVKVKAPVPVARAKAPVPAVRKKAAVPAVTK